MKLSRGFATRGGSEELPPFPEPRDGCSRGQPRSRLLSDCQHSQQSQLSQLNKQRQRSTEEIYGNIAVSIDRQGIRHPHKERGGIDRPRRSTKYFSFLALERSHMMTQGETQNHGVSMGFPFCDIGAYPHSAKCVFELDNWRP